MITAQLLCHLAPAWSICWTAIAIAALIGLAKISVFVYVALCGVFAVVVCAPLAYILYEMQWHESRSIEEKPVSRFPDRLIRGHA